MALFLATRPEAPETGPGTAVCGFVLAGPAPHQRFRADGEAQLALLKGAWLAVGFYPLDRPGELAVLLRSGPGRGCRKPPPVVRFRPEGGFGLFVERGGERFFSEDARNPAPRFRGFWLWGQEGLLLTAGPAAFLLRSARPLG